MYKGRYIIKLICKDCHYNTSDKLHFKFISKLFLVNLQKLEEDNLSHGQTYMQTIILNNISI